MSVYSPQAKFFQASYLADTTGSTQAPVYQQMGWGYITGTGAANNIDKSVSFPQAYTTVLGVVIGSIGGKSGSNPTSITDTATGIGGEANIVQAYAITTSGFTARYTDQQGLNLANGFRYSFCWIAWGII